jgi:hypothetical protein
VRWVLAATTAGVLALGPSAALADTWKASDATHDVLAFEVTADIEHGCRVERHRAPEDEKRDVTRLTVDHTADAVLVVVRLGAVPRHDPRTTYELGLRTPDSTFSIEAGRKRKGVLYANLSQVRPDPGSHDDGCPRTPEATAVPCSGLTGRIHYGSGRLTFAVPRSCLGNPPWVRVGFRATGAVANGQESVFTMFVDVVRSGSGDELAPLTPYGPRVHKG